MGLKSFCCYNSHEARLCVGCIYSLHVDAVILLARYVCMYVCMYVCNLSINCAFVRHCTK